MFIPPANLAPAIRATEAAWRRNLDSLLESGRFILGDQVAAFEREFAAAMGARHAIGVGNGTDALALALRDAGVTSPRDEVLTTPLTAAFTGLAILSAGARPRFADVDPETLQLDPADAARRTSRQTRAIIPVHLYGQPCRLDEFRRLARESGAVLIQDAAQAHGALYRGRPLADFSPYVCYSFYPTKNLGALGDGGAVTTRSGAIAARLRSLRDGGRRGGMVSFLPGVNSRLDEMQACFLRAFLPHLAEWNQHRARIASLYDEALRDCPGVRLVRRDPSSVHHLYVVRVRGRERLRQWLAARGIGSGVHYPVPLHLQPAFRSLGYKPGGFPNAERAAREVLSLPLWPYMPLEDAEKVAASVRAYFKRPRASGAATSSVDSATSRV
jgi:dTDP-3-amino-3,4,6-trideoxy-alpha-D-glucose transaminase